MASYAPLDFKEWKPQFGTISSFSDDLLKYFDKTMKVDSTDYKILEETVPTTTGTDPLLPVDHKEMSKSLSTLSSHRTDSVTGSVTGSVTESIVDKEEEEVAEVEVEVEEEEAEVEEVVEDVDSDIDEECSINSESQVGVKEQEKEEEEEEKESESMEIIEETGSNKIETESNLLSESSHMMTGQEEQEQEEEEEEETSSSCTAQDKSKCIAQPTIKEPADASTIGFLNSSPPSLVPHKRGDKSILKKSSVYFSQKMRKAKLVKDEPVKTKFSWWRKLRLFARD